VRKLLPTPVTAPPSKQKDEEKAPVFQAIGNMVNLPIAEVRFAHDSQREHFGHLASQQSTAPRRSVLQLAVELMMGMTLPDQVPTFRVCLHEGRWYSYSGNRRLAAFRLAGRFAPDRFTRLMLPVAQADDAFFRGTVGHQQKLTTARNGADCFGRWLVILETGEAVGRALPGCSEYGHDLLSLLPVPVIVTKGFVGRTPPGRAQQAVEEG